MAVRLLPALLLALVAAPAVAAPTACTTGVAEGHACRRIDLVARLDTATLGYGNLNDVWGWTDPVGGREYALVGAQAGTVFVDITDAANPRIVGRLPAHENINLPDPSKGTIPTPGLVEMCKAGSGTTGGPSPAHEGECGGNSSWRNVKVYADHAFIGSESAGHGLQVFDLTQLRSYPPGSPIERFAETAHYGGFGHSHTLWIDAASGFLYAVGSDTFNGGPHFVDIHNPANPVAAGGYGGDGYTHEIICQVYAGPDVAHAGRQICIASNEDTLTVLDVTNKGSPQQLARVTYPGVGFTHQGSLTADQRYMFVDDELDELETGERTRTLVWDFADLDAPQLLQQLHQPRFAIDHNLYLQQGYMFQSDYTSGLVVYDARDPLHAFELGYFDTHPADDQPIFDGTWSNYPFFGSGVVAVSDITRGLYLLQPHLGGTAEDARVVAVPNGSNTDFVITAPSEVYASFSVGADAQITGLNLTPANTPNVCQQTLRTFRCLFPATPGTFAVRIDASSGSGSALAVVMVAGSGDESAPIDNSVSTSIATTVVVSTTSGGGGAAAPLLGLLLVAGAFMRRRRHS